MHTAARVALTLLVSQAVASTVAWACSCVPSEETPEELLDANDRVFVGEVVSGPRGCSNFSPIQSTADQVTFTLEVTEAFKGVDVGDKIDLETARDGSSCGAGFEVGEEWLIYTSADAYGSCSPGGLAADHADDIEALRALE